MTRSDWIEAGFAPPVRGMVTTRAGGISRGPHAGLNIGERCGDDPESVAENRCRLEALLPAPPRWLAQVHGTRIVHLDDWHEGIEADGAWTDRPGQVAVVQTADCVPVLLASVGGELVAAVHAGWRGLAAGVLEAAVDALPADPARLEAWIGPAIGQQAYEVGAEVVDAFAGCPEGVRARFRPGRPGRFQADLKGIASELLGASGVGRVRDANLCTASDPGRFYSYRRDGVTGRMAALIWLEDS